MIRQSIKDVCFFFSRYACLPSTWISAARYRMGGSKRPEGHYVHLGCGGKYLDGMINADGNRLRKVDLWIDLRNKLPFPDSSCHLVYSSHTIEHLFPYQAIALLKEVRRVLKPDGVARIAVPGFAYALAIARGEASEQWPRSFEDPASQAVNYLFCDGQHKYSYTAEILESFAREAGFSRVEDYSATHGVEPKTYGPVTLGDEPVGSLIVELRP